MAYRNTLPRPKFLVGETAYCRFTGEAFPVVFCDGCIAVLRGADGTTFARIVGVLMVNPA